MKYRIIIEEVVSKEFSVDTDAKDKAMNKAIYKGSITFSEGF